MSGKFRLPLNEVARDEGIDADVDELYTEYKLATLTGWSVEYINGLGVLRTEAFLQMHEAEQALQADNLKVRKKPLRR